MQQDAWFFVKMIQKTANLCAKFLPLFLLILCEVGASRVQAQTPTDTLQRAIAPADSLAPTQSPKDSLAISRKRQARRALAWAILPIGTGQIYNRQWWKVPLYTGTTWGCAALAVKYRVDYNQAQNDYNQLVASALSGEIDAEGAADLVATLRTSREKSRRAYNFAFAGTIFAYGYSLADAYFSNRILTQPNLALRAPLQAGIRSAALPGLGQIYNRKYWKLPIVYGGFAVAGGFIGFNLYEYNRFSKEYKVRTRPGYGEINPDLRSYSASNLLTARKYYRRNLEYSVVGGTLWYILNILDAVVDAHLKGFNTDDDLSLWRIQPFAMPETGQLPAHRGLMLHVAF